MSADGLESSSAPPSAPQKVGHPMWLLAELTYKCPLHCVFCYNPIDYTNTFNDELSTEEWICVLKEGREIGAVQLGLSGGEPLMRDDLETIIGEAHQTGYYTNLITSGVGLTEPRIKAMKAAGLDHIQLSFQDSTREMNDFLSSTRTFDLKNKVAQLIKQYDYPMVFNCVIHRLNIDHIDKILDMAENMEAEYVELANTQYYAWAHVNRDHLLPTHEQLIRAEKIADEYKARLGNKMRIFFVAPDFYENRPKACMNGWGSVFTVVTADGALLPCHEARMLPGINFPNVRERGLKWAWYESEAFNKYRGDDWMQEPCRSCPEKTKDFGGCRCQAFLLTGDATNADPVCDKSQHHEVVLAARDNAARKSNVIPSKPISFRNDKNSRQLSADGIV